MSDEQLKLEKKKMDKKFEENFIKPGDIGYVYDKVVDFSSQKKEANPWDDGDDEEEYSENWDE